MRNFFKLVVSVYALWELLIFIDLFDKSLPHLHYVLLCLTDILFIIELFNSLVLTFKIVGISLVVGSLLGYIVGILMSLYPYLYSNLYHILNGIKSIPASILLPLAIALFGLQDFAIPIIALPIFAILAVNISNACLETNSNRKSLIIFLNLSKYFYWKNVLFYETLDTLLSSMRIVITYALALQIAFEFFLQHKMGIGKLIHDYYYGDQEGNDAKLFFCVIVIALIGVYSIKFLDKYSNSKLKWKIKT